MVTSSFGPGITPPTHVAVEFHGPPPAVELIGAAKLQMVVNATRKLSRNNLRRYPGKVLEKTVLIVFIVFALSCCLPFLIQKNLEQAFHLFD
jgi:hypothetical protein